MASIFHHFPLLPKELRDQIWDMAVRPNRPGVHFFSVVDSLDRKDAAAARFPVASQRSPRNPSNVRLAAPTLSESDPSTLSWTTDNSSTYLYDAGLWTACKESRERIMKRFNPDRSITGYFITEEGARHFAIDPYSDLVCIRRRVRYPYSKKFMNRQFSGGLDYDNVSIAFRDRGPDVLAIEFDPEWVREKDWEESINFSDMLHTIREDMQFVERLFFIDYRVHARDTSNLLRSATFFSNDHAFVWGVASSNDYTDDSPCEDIIEFVETLNEKLQSMESSEWEANEYEVTGPSPFVYILTCEPLDSS